MANHAEAHADAASHEGHDEHEHHEHITPIHIYVGVFVALLFLTAITVWIAQFDFGSDAINTAIAMLVATVKATLVCLFFMHLLHDDKINSLAFVFGLIFTALFFVFTLLDFATRDAIDPIKDTNYPAKEALAELKVEAEKLGAAPIAKAPPYREGFAAPDERGTVAPPPSTPVEPEPEVKIEIPKDIDQALAAKGKTLFTEKGCAACHSIDGTKLVGPTHKGIWGRTEELEGGGTAVVNFEYYAESVKEPNAKITKGYPPAMAKLEITDEEIKALAEYSRSLGVVVEEAKPDTPNDVVDEAPEGTHEPPAPDEAPEGNDEPPAPDEAPEGTDEPPAVEPEAAKAADAAKAAEPAPASVQRQGDRIAVPARVKFVKGKFNIAKDSLGTLDQVAKFLKDNPDIKRVEIAGHADDAGSDKRNQSVSFDRAFVVRKHLSKKGVSPKRLRAKGYANTKPQGDNNNRVDFIILE